MVIRTCACIFHLSWLEKQNHKAYYLFHMLTCKINLWNQCDFKMRQVVTKKKKERKPIKCSFCWETSKRESSTEWSWLLKSICIQYFHLLITSFLLVEIRLFSNFGNGGNNREMEKGGKLTVDNFQLSGFLLFISSAFD